MVDVINLFEYQNRVEVLDSFSDLESFLDEIWNNREKSLLYFAETEDRVETQQFIQFIHKTQEIISNKYVGVIHFNGRKINLLPKIFHDSSTDQGELKVHQIQNHILWWLSYCRKIKFPNYQTSMGNLKSDFFEVLIYLFSKYTRELLSNSIYQQYEEISSELTFIKGRINTQEYINQNISKGRWHKLNCTFDAFEFDNKFNRIIKYVTTLLFSATSSSENKKHLREILFILDEISDERATPEECSLIQFNPIFQEFETVRDYCHLFLSSCISFDYKADLKLFAFLLPMEYVFEDFIFGFIDKEVDSVSVKPQVSSIYLDVDENFQLRPDLILKSGDVSFIADTKYKIVYSDEKDPKKGISQSDLYQMLAYAVRFNINEIILFYPNTVMNYQESSSEVIIEDALADHRKVRIRSYQLPVINQKILEQQFNPSINLEEIFEPTRIKLKERLEDILIPLHEIIE